MKLQENKHYVLITKTSIINSSGVCDTIFTQYLITIMKELPLEGDYIAHFVNLNLIIRINLSEWEDVRELYPLEEALM